MRKMRICSFLLVVVAGLAGCSGGEGAQSATVLHLVEQERGTDPYRTRMIATDSFLRIDDGEGSRSFILFDRKAKTIYSVNALDSRILVIHSRAIDVASPIVLRHKVEKDDVTMPDIAGKKPVHYRLLTNDKVCYDLFAANGLLPKANQALREFYETLAYEQAVTLTWTPKEMMTPCGLANNIFLPTRHLVYGFPVRLEDMNGRTSQLVDFHTDFKPRPELFELPASYHRTTMEELRER